MKAFLDRRSGATVATPTSFAIDGENPPNGRDRKSAHWPWPGARAVRSTAEGRSLGGHMGCPWRYCRERLLSRNSKARSSVNSRLKTDRLRPAVQSASKCRSGRGGTSGAATFDRLLSSLIDAANRTGPRPAEEDPPAGARQNCDVHCKVLRTERRPRAACPQGPGHYAAGTTNGAWPEGKDGADRAAMAHGTISMRRTSSLRSGVRDRRA